MLVTFLTWFTESLTTTMTSTSLPSSKMSVDSRNNLFYNLNFTTYYRPLLNALSLALGRVYRNDYKEDEQNIARDLLIQRITDIFSLW